jgi:hypothetical protein
VAFSVVFKYYIRGVVGAYVCCGTAFSMVVCEQGAVSAMMTAVQRQLNSVSLSITNRL